MVDISPSSRRRPVTDHLKMSYHSLFGGNEVASTHLTVGVGESQAGGMARPLWIERPAGVAGPRPGATNGRHKPACQVIRCDPIAPTTTAARPTLVELTVWVTEKET